MKKKLFLSLFSLLCLHKIVAQNNLEEETKVQQLCLVWGFLKYHHPEISKGKVDVDELFLKLYNQLNLVDKQEEVNTIFLNIINSYGDISNNTNNNSSERDRLNFFENEDYNWIENLNFNKELTNKLLLIKNNYSNPKGYYASQSKLSKILNFDNEKIIEDFDFNSTPHRLLSLARFWNIINYYNVNKFLFDDDWNNVLNKFIKPFMDAKSKLDYDILKAKLVSNIDDSHAFYFPQGLYDSLFNYKPPFGTRIINDTLLISNLYNKDLSSKDSLRGGDIITHIDGKPINEYMENKFGSFFSASNKDSWNRIHQYYALYNSTDEVNVTYYSPMENKHLKKTIHLYESYDLDKQVKRSLDKGNEINTSKEVGETSLYINLEAITNKELKKISKTFDKYNGLIFDLRNYPKSIAGSDIAKYIYPERKEFIKVLFPTNIPSIGDYNADAPLKLIADPFKAGKKNNNYYKGKVILLVINSTISKAEYIGMAIQSAPNSVTIGETTAGAVMNIITIPLPDGDNVNFTGMTAYYPNGEVVQRKGLKIDHIVHQSALHPDQDLQLEKALEIINKSK
ncbi:periplasmic protease [Galbibacter orientalis DSM 19592]|uniref:Periplasmic protease n=1 Tax=Galbibacter orientalis DSM 19592 TaxID=926559 RepID=I3C421_9FLAO|nr:S41 family peptidase [Galbibacter orientalis]EIJ38364.1 periplasmic protease [Galbibacter orientalis DSM 19592]